MAEQGTHNPLVAGSSPAGRTMKRKPPLAGVLLYAFAYTNIAMLSDAMNSAYDAGNDELYATKKAE